LAFANTSEALFANAREEVDYICNDARNEACERLESVRETKAWLAESGYEDRPWTQASLRQKAHYRVHGRLREKSINERGATPSLALACDGRKMLWTNSETQEKWYFQSKGEARIGISPYLGAAWVGEIKLLFELPAKGNECC
jgi:hypothetical protein